MRLVQNRDMSRQEVAYGKRADSDCLLAKARSHLDCRKAATDQRRLRVDGGMLRARVPTLRADGCLSFGFPRIHDLSS
jgi:hypothetical protein